jgi:hypothetical protein
VDWFVYESPDTLMLLTKNFYSAKAYSATPTPEEWETVVVKYEDASLWVPSDWEGILPRCKIPLEANTTLRELVSAVNHHYTSPLQTPKELLQMHQDAQYVYSYGHQYGLEVLQALDLGKPVCRLNLIGKRMPEKDSLGSRRKPSDCCGLVRFEGISHGFTEPCGLPLDLKLELGSSW